jgi:nitrate reductase gamma subunit
MALFVIWPFTRLVHAFTAPLHYLFRPYIVYRSRDKDQARGSVPARRKEGASAARTTGTAARRGWSAVGTRDRDTRNR